MTQRRPSKPIEALPETPIVLIVDDDSSVREALGRLFRSVDLEPKLFASVAELMRHKFPDAPCCLVLDIRLPGVSGLDFQTQLVKANIHVPIIMMTGHGDIPMSVRAMKGGAVDFLTKPFRDRDMLDAVAQEIERDRKRRDSDKALAELRGLFESLTPRGREIMALVTMGLMNKQVAGELGLSEITVKIHRGHIMRKMGVRSLADLVRAAEAPSNCISRRNPRRKRLHDCGHPFERGFDLTLRQERRRQCRPRLVSFPLTRHASLP